MQYDAETALCAAVVAAYSVDELEMLLFQHCGGVRLDLIAPAAVNFEITVFKVVRTAGAQGWLEKFVEAVIDHRRGNAELRMWTARYHVSTRAARPAHEAAEPMPPQQLMDTTHFDLAEVRHAIRAAVQSPGRSVIGFGVHYPESLFVQKLLEWLQFYLPGETQSKATLSLMPEIAPLDYCLRQLHSYRPDLDDVNVLCEIAVRGVAADVIGEFWNGVRTQFDKTAGNLVLVFTGDRRTDFPDDVTALPQPRFNRMDVADWTERLISQRGWPGSVAYGWTESLCAAACIRDEQLDVRLLYEAMDRSVAVLRQEPEKFRAMHEKRS